MSKGLFDRLKGELDAREKTPGLQMSDLLTMPEPASGLLNWMVRQGQVTVPEIMAFLKQNEDCTRTMLADLRDMGYVCEVELRGVTRYRVRIAPKRGRRLPENLWKALDDKVGPEEARE